MAQTPGRTTRTLLAIIAVILVLAALRASWYVTMPLVFAVFLAVLVWPLQRRLQRRLPLWLSVALLLMMLASGLIAAGAIIWFSISQLLQQGPPISGKLQQQLDALRQWAQGLGLTIDERVLQDANVLRPALDWVTAGVASVWDAVGLIGLLLIFFVFLLLEMDQWRTKVQQVFSPQTAEVVRETARTIIHRLQRYLMVRVFISVLSGVLVFGWCMLLDITLALVWGVITFLFNFIPNIGSILSYVFPVATAWIQYDWRWALLTLGCISGTDLVVGNFLEPRLQGRSLRISPLVVIVSIALWGWVWGVGGMVLAVPITASLVIVFSHIKSLEVIGKLLSEPRQ